MFKVDVDSLTAYFNFDPQRTDDLKRLDKLIRASAPKLARYFHRGTPAGEPGMRFKMIGYGRFHYLAKSGRPVEWPVVGIALQKNYISVYLSVSQNGGPLLKRYVDKLNCLRAGGNNFSFERFDDLDARALGGLFTEAGKIFAQDPNNPIAYRSR